MRKSLYFDTKKECLVEEKELDPKSDFDRYYYLYADDDYNGDFIELWTSTLGHMVKVTFTVFEDINLARKFVEQENHCKLVDLKSVKVPYVFFERFVE